MADYTAVREVMEELGYTLMEAGFDAPMKIIEGNNAVGRAVRDCRDTHCVVTIKNFLRETVKSIKTLPSNEIDNNTRQFLLKECGETWDAVVEAMTEGLEGDSRPAAGAIANWVNQR